jgi:DNA-binding NtrC family response regulator
VKPLDLRELEQTLRALLRSSAPGEPALPAAAEPEDAPLLIGSAPAMQPAFAAIAHATASDAPVLITGPTGIGKSLAARVIHLHSRRHAAPFVTLSCASLPETLLEAELFGHEKGAFTGAIATKTGHIERAAGGTLFLEEIAEIPPAAQVKLLRFVEEKVFSRVGGREDMRVDLRLIAATNRDLAQAVAEKRFREDLLYRLRVLEVKLPSLRERISDLPALCSYLIARLAKDRKVTLSGDALGLLMRHDWPGNVRELRNALEHAAAVCGGTTILPQHLPVELQAGIAAQPASMGRLDEVLAEWLGQKLGQGLDYNAIHGELERRLLAALLPRFEGKPTLLARALDMNRATLRKKLRESSGQEAE